MVTTQKFLFSITEINVVYSRRIKTKLLHSTNVLLFRSPTCFGQIYWPTSGSHIQRYLNLEFSSVVTAVVVFTIIKIGLYLKYSRNITKIAYIFIVYRQHTKHMIQKLTT